MATCYCCVLVLVVGHTFLLGGIHDDVMSSSSLTLLICVRESFFKSCE
jgi:hypothetical protein